MKVYIERIEWYPVYEASTAPEEAKVDNELVFEIPDELHEAYVKIEALYREVQVRVKKQYFKGVKYD